MLMLMDFGQVYGLGEGRKREGRPMVWDIHKVREETNHSCSPPFTYFPCCLLMSKMHQDPRRPLMHYTKYPSPPRRQCSHHTQLLRSYPPPDPSHPYRVHASTDTRSRGSSAGVFCNDVVGVHTSLDPPNRSKDDAVFASFTTKEDMTTITRLMSPTLHQSPVDATTLKEAHGVDTR